MLGRYVQQAVRRMTGVTMMNNEVVIGGMYRHFKGFIAKVITIATHTETGEILVVYEYTNGENHKFGIYARPMEMFLSEIDHNKYPDVKQKHRFELIKQDDDFDFGFFG